MTFPRRIDYPDLDNLTPVQEKLRERMGPRRGGPDATRLMKMVVNFPTYMNSIAELGTRTADNNSIPERQYQLISMRCSWLCGAEYLWSQHRIASLKLGITDEELFAVAEGSGNDLLRGLDQAVIVAVDELHFDHRFSDESWVRFDEVWGPDAKIDIILTYGIYSMMSCFANSTGTDLEDGVPGFSGELLRLAATQKAAG